MKEHCVSCGVETAYEVSTHIDMRSGYIEGLGQLCVSCYNSSKERNHIIVPESTIIMTPNNSELGSKVRELYYETKD
jgi:hypothetical protein